MSPKLQSSLLRVLQDHSFTRIGSTQLRKADFRLVCATNRPLPAEVKAGRFREDLYYRIAVVSLRMPPLRERAGDILSLATYFLDHYNVKFSKACGPFTPPALQALETRRWEGNVRELQHCIERAVALHTGGPIDLLHTDLLHLFSSESAVDEASEAGDARTVLPYEAGGARGIRA